MHVNKETHQSYEVPRASGWAKLKVTGDDVSVKIKVRGVAPGIAHAQHIHAGPACPDPATDPNNDGVLDVIEGLPAYGPILVNLDSDLSSNAAGMFPMANAYGRDTYSAKGSKTHIEAEIQQALRLGIRHVVIHGVDPTTPCRQRCRAFRVCPPTRRCRLPAVSWFVTTSVPATTVTIRRATATVTTAVTPPRTTTASANPSVRAVLRQAIGLAQHLRALATRCVRPRPRIDAVSQKSPERWGLA